MVSPPYFSYTQREIHSQPRRGKQVITRTTTTNDISYWRLKERLNSITFAIFPAVLQMLLLSHRTHPILKCMCACIYWHGHIILHNMRLHLELKSEERKEQKKNFEPNYLILFVGHMLLSDHNIMYALLLHHKANSPSVSLSFIYTMPWITLN